MVRIDITLWYVVLSLLPVSHRFCTRQGPRYAASWPSSHQCRASATANVSSPQSTRKSTPHASAGSTAITLRSWIAGCSVDLAGSSPQPAASPSRFRHGALALGNIIFHLHSKRRVYARPVQLNCLARNERYSGHLLSSLITGGSELPVYHHPHGEASTVRYPLVCEGG